MGRKSRSRSSSPARSKKEKEKEKKDKDKRSRSRRGKEKDRQKDKEKEKDRDRDRDKEKEKDRDRHKEKEKEKEQEKDREKEKDRDKEKKKDKEREKDTEDKADHKKDDRNGRGRDRRGSSSSRSRSKSDKPDDSDGEADAGKLWPIVVATGRRTLQLLAAAAELHQELPPAEAAVGSKSRQVAPEKPAMFRPSLGLDLAMPSSGLSSGLALAASGQGVAPSGYAPLGRPDGHYTGASLAQQTGKSQICFNFVGGRCFRENCRFLHLGPGGPGGAPPPAQSFTGLAAPGGRRGGFS